MHTWYNNLSLLLIVIFIPLLLVTLFIATNFFFYQRKAVLYYKQIEDIRSNYEKKLLQRQSDIQEQTFQDISAEIHDSIGLSLTLAKLHLNITDFTNLPEIIQHIHFSAELIDETIAELRDLSASLNGSAIKSNGLYHSLKTETERINRGSKQRAEFLGEGNIVFLDEQKELILYRIVQEALNNILKHAAADYIWIRLYYGHDYINLSVEDNGTGFNETDIEKKKWGKLCNGFSNMRARAAMINGNLVIKSGTGNGTKISVTAPY